MIMLSKLDVFIYMIVTNSKREGDLCKNLNILLMEII